LNSLLPWHHVEWRSIVHGHDQTIKKFGENYAKEAYQLNLYPMANHGNYMSQYLIHPFWRPYLHNLYFTICIILSTNLSTLEWSCKIICWFINAFSHNFCPQNSMLWLMKTLIETQTYWTFYLKMHVQLSHYCNLAIQH
jgi:hypothetical protein